MASQWDLFPFSVRYSDGAYVRLSGLPVSRGLTIAPASLNCCEASGGHSAGVFAMTVMWQLGGTDSWGTAVSQTGEEPCSPEA